jgi:hypothetical protein
MKLPRQPSDSQSPSGWLTTRVVHSFSIRNLCVLTVSIQQLRGLEFFIASSGLTPPKWWDWWVEDSQLALGCRDPPLTFGVFMQVITMAAEDRGIRMHGIVPLQ